MNRNFTDAMLKGTVNPYYTAASMMLRRLKWDFHPESWRSRRRLKNARGSHDGEKAVILCNGPSLLKSDLGLLNGVFTFGLNKINLLFDQSEFRPSCIVAVNPFVIEQNADFYNQSKIPLFLDTIGLRWVRTRPEISFLHSINFPRFAQDCSFSIWQGATVTYVALQLAFHLGFGKVALIGADHSFATKGLANKEVLSGEKDLSHFDPRYFSGGMKWHLPDLPQSELAYSMARDAYAASGRSIYNCTVGGHLEIFERMTLEEFVS